MWTHRMRAAALYRMNEGKDWERLSRIFEYLTNRISGGR